MPKSRPPYPPEYRRRIVELARSGPRINDLAREFGVTANSIRNWRKQADLNAGRRSDGLTSDEREELNRLRRECRMLREEKEILKKAAGLRSAPHGSIFASGAKATARVGTRRRTKAISTCN